MKKVADFWRDLVNLTGTWGLNNSQQRQIQSLVLGGIEPLPVMDEVATKVESATGKPKFALGAGSLSRLVGVKTELVKTVHLAIQLTDQDFTVYEGLRTRERQAQLVKQGYSQTMESQHIAQADGFGHAVDLVPWISGHPVWDWDGCYKVACAMDAAATQLGYANHIRWGGAWDRVLSDFGGDWSAYKAETEAYAKRHVGADFLDGPHFEWRN